MRDRTEWLKARRRGIGGSDVAGILGVSKWRTPRDIWLSKIETGEPDDSPSVQQMIGTALEPHVLDQYARQTGRHVRKSHRILTRDHYLLASLDATAAGRIIEIKTARNQDGWGDPGSDDIPTEYWLQVQHYLHVAEADHCDLAVMFLNQPNPQAEIYPIKRSADYNDIAQQLLDWWGRHVIGNAEPEPVNSAECNDRWRRSVAGKVTASSETETALGELRSVRVRLADLKERQDQLETQIKTAMADADSLVSPSGEVLATWRTSVSRRLDSAAIRAANPELAHQCTVESVSRRFLLKGGVSDE